MRTDGSIGGFAVGDDLDYEVTVTDVPEGMTITKAWLMAKRLESDDDADAVIARTITTDDQAGSGVITNDSDAQTATLLFRLRTDQTSALTARVAYPYGVKVKLSNGNTDTIETGVLCAGPTLVQASS